MAKLSALPQCRADCSALTREPGKLTCSLSRRYCPKRGRSQPKGAAPALDWRVSTDPV